ncbi:unnamed protein product [Psylliodes chrysocephalus]|uniref:Uncharacterized protein n=1 Tax=Psylliodes chrysocephalus TaxID=3402493 RepID=A0A9P0CXE0_9CUCU|nr:unnamed protein product [Psylliodes chrysocephala]
MIRNILNKLLRRVSRSKEYILNRSKIHKVNVELLEHKMKEFIIYIIIFHVICGLVYCGSKNSVDVNPVCYSKCIFLLCQDFANPTIDRVPNNNIDIEKIIPKFAESAEKILKHLLSQIDDSSRITNAILEGNPESVAKDFFGRIITKPTSCGKGGPELNNDIWYQYKEGYNNAVRKIIKISDLS